MSQIYIAGKVSGEDFRECYKKFNTAQLYVEKEFGQLAFNPMKRVSYSWSWLRCMIYCIRVLKTECDKIYMLKDWKLSRGARWEHRVAKRNKITIYYE